MESLRYHRPKFRLLAGRLRYFHHCRPV